MKAELQLHQPASSCRVTGTSNTIDPGTLQPFIEALNRPSGAGDASPAWIHADNAPAVINQREKLLRQKEHAFEMDVAD